MRGKDDPKPEPEAGFSGSARDAELAGDCPQGSIRNPANAAAPWWLAGRRIGKTTDAMTSIVGLYERKDVVSRHTRFMYVVGGLIATTSQARVQVGRTGYPMGGEI
jgi:hypothetical protein